MDFQKENMLFCGARPVRIMISNYWFFIAPANTCCANCMKLVSSIVTIILAAADFLEVLAKIQ
jgi:hypothetical protein